MIHVDEMRRDCQEYIHWLFVLMDYGSVWTAEQQKMKTRGRILAALPRTAADVNAVLQDLETEIGLPAEAPELEARKKEVERLGALLYQRLVEGSDDRKGDV